MTRPPGRGAALALLPAAAIVACTPSEPPGWAGYAEGDYVLVAAPVPGTLTVLATRAGRSVTRGAALFTLESDAESAAVAEAQARLETAQAQARDTDYGRRAEELAVTRAQLDQARAQAALARVDLTRQQELTAQGFVSPARLDEARATLAQSQARVAELESALAAANLPARPDERQAARAQAGAASAAREQSAWRLRQKEQSAPVDAVVADTFFRPGEYVAAGQPVVSLLPAGAVKARFFVPETDAATLKPGDAVKLRCDGCGAPLAARVSYVATRAEYTPPVIYSNTQRTRLVFMVEAWPEAADASRLRPGQPIDVVRAAR
jgi:HlyD family secretion protein